MTRLATSGFLASALLLVALSARAAVAPEPAPGVWMRVEPAEVAVDLFYSGATVRVEGLIPAGSDAAILCRGEGRAVELKRKGKVLGLLWMNVADVVFEDVPSLYLLSTSRALTELGPDPLLQELGVGYLALESMAVGSHGETGNERDFREFVKLEERDGLYAYDEGGLKLEAEASGAMRVSGECRLPPKAPWGDYEVRLFAFKAGQGALLRSERFQVVPTGLTGQIRTLAMRNGTLYGVLAVLIAVGVGLLTGLAFNLLSKKGH